MAKQIHTLEPASKIVSIFGGCRALALTLKVCPSTISRWSTSNEQRGTDGKIPQKYWGQIMVAAQDIGKTVTLSDLSGFTDSQFNWII